MKKFFIKFLGGFTQDEVKEIKNENFLLHEKQKRLETLFENISRYKGTYPACKAYNEFLEVIYHNDKYLSDYVEEYLKKLCISFIVYFKSESNHQAVEYWERMLSDSEERKKGCR
ncbi:TPA: hypothetical protein ACQFL4_003019 [Proteus mirabilis]